MKIRDPARLRHLRMEGRYSQRDLARLMQKSQASIHALEAGKLKTISPTFARSLAARFGVPCEELFDNDD